MCGLSVLYNKNYISDSAFKEFQDSLRLISHRGPDSDGMSAHNVKENKSRGYSKLPEVNYNSELTADLLLGHKRLSILDVSEAGHQPFDYLHYSMVFNGEIYNYIEIRKELQALGYTFLTQTDTEVIIAAYDAWKEMCLPKFNGMFSFIIYNAKEHNLFIANDRFGVKPLYYYKDPARLILTSEVKQFYAYNLNLTLNTETVNTFLDKAYIDYDEQTFFKEVRRFPKAHFCYVDLNTDLKDLNFVSYYSLKTIQTAHSNTVEEFNALFTDAVKLRMRSDVPIGFASSGGLDSSSILYKAYGLLKKEGKELNIKTFSAIFPGLSGDESEFIKYIENDLKIRSFYVNPLELFSVNDFEDHIRHQDMPVASTSYYAEWCVARLVRNNDVKVLLIGQGGDELLAGYHHHFYRYCRQLILQGKLRKYLTSLKSFCELKSLDKNKLHKQIINEVKYAVKIKLGLKDMHHALETHWNSANKLIDLLKIDFSETMLPTYLRSDDRDSMAFGLETRHPFLDYRLVDFCFSLPDEVKIKDGWQKSLLREAMTELPDTIRYRKDKKGYTTPQQVWIEKNKMQFNEYLNHIPEQYKNKSTADPFLNYAFGAWCKVNNIK
ncbi:MAG: asparagine synthase (glutamine-hydrolyzing) [Bacteroidota bacterium]